jgi:quinol monooxygenase YgiN
MNRVLVAALISGLGLSGCAIGMPMRGEVFDAADGEALDRAPVLVVVTEATLVSDRALRRDFWNHVGRIAATLDDAPGCLGHSRSRTLGGSKAWTLTVWADRESLERFMYAGPHAAAMREATDALADFRSVSRVVDQSGLPTSWNQARAWLERPAAAPTATGGAP